MNIKINGKLVRNAKELVSEVNELCRNSNGPIRKETEIDAGSGRTIVHFRTRKISEYLFEKIICNVKEKKDIKNECRSSIAHIMSPLINKAAADEIGQIGRNSLVIEDEMESSLPGLSGQKKSEEKDIGNESPRRNSGSNSASAKELRECFEKLDGKVFKKKANEIGSFTSKIRSKLGLFQVPEGLSVSICPVLQCIANNAIVSSVGAQSLSCVRTGTPLGRALKDFAKAWKVFTKDQKSQSESYGELPFTAGLQHIQHLLCLGDSTERGRSGQFFDQSQWKWEAFYLELLTPMQGTVVLQLYPDFYEDDLSVASGKVPYFSENNIAGAVKAAIKMNSKYRKDGRPPISIMFAGVNGIVANAIAKNIEEQRSLEVYRARISAEVNGVKNHMKALAFDRNKNSDRHAAFKTGEAGEAGQADNALSTSRREKVSGRDSNHVQLIQPEQGRKAQVQSSLLDDHEN